MLDCSATNFMTPNTRLNEVLTSTGIKGNIAFQTVNQS